MKQHSTHLTVRQATGLALVILTLPLARPHAATTTNQTLLSIDRLFGSGEFDPQSVETVVWRQHGPGYYTLEKPAGGGPGQELVWYDPANDRKEIIVPAHSFIPPRQSSPLAIEEFQLSADESQLLIYTRSQRVWRQHTRGDYWVLDLTSRELRQLGGTAPPSSLQFAKFSPDGRQVAYVRQHNLYVQDLQSLRITALTTNGSETLINGTSDWVYEEELDLRDGFRWSPDSQAIAYWQLDSAGVRTYYLINDTDGLYSRPIAIPYPKTGQQNSAARIGVVSARGGPTRWLQAPGDARNHYLVQMDWASNSTEIVLQQFNRLQNTNRLMLADARTEETRTVLTETDTAWVDNDNQVWWLNQANEFVWLSERGGWRQAYRVARDGKALTLLTPGNYDVLAIDGIDTGRNWLYFSASPDSPTQRYLYRVSLAGGAPQLVTPANQPGTHSYQLSPDAQWAVHTYSTFTQPPRTDLVHLPDYKVVKVLADNKALRAKLQALKAPGAELFRVAIGEGVWLDGWCLKPPNFEPSRKYPVLFYVYGEPAGQTVLDSWEGKAQLWHWLLAQQGYVVISVDNRGTPAPRGRAWRKIIYRQVGVLAADDQAAAVRALLQQRPYLDSRRVGIWGWSGGGSMTLNAILRYPELYQTAMAVAPVANMRFYDTIYQERYMGLPQENADGYRRGSPITYAAQLKGNLLLVHGTGDDNVHYQGTEALINELIAYNKPFTMMAYPNRTHAIAEGKNTRRHLYNLLTRFLNQNLPVHDAANDGKP